VVEANALTLFRDGVAAARAGDRPRARLLLSEATLADPDNEVLWLWLAGVAERPQDAVAHLERVLRLNPASDRAREGLKSSHLQAGVAEVKAGNPASARAHLRAAVAFDPESEAGWWWLAGVADSPQEAVDALRKVVALAPGNTRARARLVELFLGQAHELAQAGERDEARRLLHQALQSEPACVPAWLALAGLADGPEEAVSYLERAVALAPDDERARALLAEQQALLTPAWACPLCQGPDEPAPGTPCPGCGALLDLSDPEALLRHEPRDPGAVLRAVARLEADLPPGGDFTLHYWLGLALANARRWPDAFRHLQAALSLRSDRALRAQVNRLAQLHASSSKHPEEKRRTVLVVDDSATVRKAVGLALGGAGYLVRAAADGREAIHSLREQGLPDLILLDVAMPGLDGYQLCKLIKATPAARDVPVVMLSGKDGFFDKVRGRWAGATAYLTKPVSASALVAEAQKHCRPRQGASG
jgi:twitching motility two-component system response regulator PilG